MVDRFILAGMAGKFGGMRMDGEGGAHKKRLVLSYLISSVKAVKIVENESKILGDG